MGACLAGSPVVRAHASVSTDVFLKSGTSRTGDELIFGVPRSASPPGPDRLKAVRAFYVALANHAREHNRGYVRAWPVEIALDWDRGLVLRADVAFVASGRLPPRRGVIVLGPDLLIETLPPCTRDRPMRQRLEWFARYGVRECWLVHLSPRPVEIVDVGRSIAPRREVDVLSFTDGKISSRRRFDELTPIQSTALPSFQRSLQSVLDGRLPRG